MAVPVAERYGSPDQFKKNIPSTVRDVLSNPSKLSRRATELGHFLGEQPVELTLRTLQEVQLRLLEPGKKRTRDIFTLMDNIGEGGFSSSVPRTLTFTPDVIDTLRAIVRNNISLQKRFDMADPQIPGSYRDIIYDILPKLKRELQNGNTQATIDPSVEEEKIMIVAAPENHVAKRKTWLLNASELQTNRTVNGAQRTDRLLTVLAQEVPELGEEAEFYRVRGDISLAELEFSLPELSEKDYDKMTNYLLDLLSNYKGTFSKSTMVSLFTTITHFDPDKKRQFHNSGLLAKFNQWQERFLFDLVHNPNPQKDKKIAHVLSQLPDDARDELLANTTFFALYPWATDPHFKGEGEEGSMSGHPFVARADRKIISEATNIYVPHHFTHVEDILHREYVESTLPNLRARLTQFGIEGKTKDTLIALDHQASAIHPSQGRLEIFDDNFKKHPDRTAPSLLENNRALFRTEAASVWEHIIDSGLQSLPLTDGVESIKFSKGTLQKAMGLEKVMITRDGDTHDWFLHVRFDVSNFLKENGKPITIVGTLDHRGNFSLATALDEKIPGISAFFELVAKSAVHDMCVIEFAEQAQAKQEGLKPKAPSEVEATDTPPKEPSGDVRGGIIPRKQRVRVSGIEINEIEDTEVEKLIEIQKKRNPHPVKAHAFGLRGGTEYHEAVKAYMDTLHGATKALLELDSPEKLAQWKEQMKTTGEVVEMTRGRLYKINPDKAQAWAPNLIRRPVLYPFGKDEHGNDIYDDANTWAEATMSPKPTPEQVVEGIQYGRVFSISKSGSAFSNLNSLRDKLAA